MDHEWHTFVHLIKRELQEQQADQTDDALAGLVFNELTQLHLFDITIEHQSEQQQEREGQYLSSDGLDARGKLFTQQPIGAHSDHIVEVLVDTVLINAVETEFVRSGSQRRV